MNKLSKKEEQKMLNLDLTNSDEVVEYIESFYENKNIKSEKELIDKLTKYKPLANAIKLQKELIK